MILSGVLADRVTDSCPQQRAEQGWQNKDVLFPLWLLVPEPVPWCG